MIARPDPPSSVVDNGANPVRGYGKESSFSASRSYEGFSIIIWEVAMSCC